MLLLFEKMVWSIAYNLQPLRDCVTSPLRDIPLARPNHVTQPHVTFLKGSAFTERGL